MIWAMAALIVILMALVAWGDIKLMLGFLAVVIVAGVGLISYDHWADKRAAEMIPLSEVQIAGFEVESMAGSVYELTGRVENQSTQYPLRKLAVRISAQDCEAENCVTIGEITSWLHTDVPAGQARDIKDKIMLKEGRPDPKGELRWKFEVVSTQGG